MIYHEKLYDMVDEDDDEESVVTFSIEKVQHDDEIDDVHIADAELIE